MVRRSGQAPYAGSYPSRTSSSFAAGASSRVIWRSASRSSTPRSKSSTTRSNCSLPSGLKITMSSIRLINSGRNAARSASIASLRARSGSRWASPKIAVEPTLLVMTNTVLRKSTVRPFTSVRRCLSFKERGPACRQPHLYNNCLRFSSLLCAGRRSHCRCPDIDLNLLRLGFLALWNAQGQHSIVIVGLDRFRIHGVGQREAAAERPIGTLHAQVLVFGHLGLELALAANGQDVVLHANVEILGIDLGEIGLHDQLVLGLVNIDRRRPSGEAGILASALESVIEQATDLVLKSGNPAKGLKTVQSPHLYSPPKVITHES